MKFYAVALILSLVASFPSYSENYSLYLVRHAEKQVDGTKDPSLTRCGQDRAEQLAKMLTNVDIEVVYSTQYKRTMATASPTALTKNLTVEQYSPKQLTQFAQELKQLKQNALIVGHSNTTPQLTSLLINEKVASMTEQEYQHLFQVNIVGESIKLVKLTQPLNCS